MYDLIEENLETLEDSYNAKLVMIEVIRNVVLGLKKYN